MLADGRSAEFQGARLALPTCFWQATPTVVTWLPESSTFSICQATMGLANQNCESNTICSYSAAGKHLHYVLPTTGPAIQIW